MNNTNEELTRLSELIGLIYEGATNPLRWTDAILPAVCEYIQAPQCVLSTPLHVPSLGGFRFMAGIPQAQHDLFISKYAKEDVWTLTALDKGLINEGNVIIGEDHVPRKELLASRYYKEFLSRENMVQLLTSVVFGFDVVNSMPVVCSFWRGLEEPSFGEQERSRLRLILPHLSHSLGVMQRIRSAELTMATSLAALDRLPTGVVLVDAASVVTFANRAALRLLENGDGLRLKKLTRTPGLGNLSADHELTTRAISAALRATLNCDPYDIEHFSDCVMVPRTGGFATYTLQFSALGRHSEFAAGDKTPAAIIFIADGEQRAEIAPQHLQNAYKLTPAEARTALALLDCGSAQEVADYLGIAYHTVRGQIRDIYAKLNVDSRARFVKLMLGLAKNRG